MNDYMLIPLAGKAGEGKFLKINFDDYSLLEGRSCFLIKGYPSIKLRGKIVKVHRLVMGNPEGLEIDHEHGDKLDARREKLRICTRLQNASNRKQQRGFKGVTFDALAEKRGWKAWGAYIQVKRETFYLGRFPTEQLAAQRYNLAAVEHFGAFARLNNVPAITADEISAFNSLNKTTSSPFLGVSFSKSRWVAQVEHSGQKLHLGYFDNETEAARAYDQAILRIKGPLAKVNFPDADAKLAQEIKRRHKKVSSKYRGVSWSAQKSKWRVSIYHQGKDIHLGFFNSELEAARAYNEAAKRLKGDDAKLNII